MNFVFNPFTGNFDAVNYVSLGPHSPVPLAWQGPGTLGWAERPCWPSEVFSGDPPVPTGDATCTVDPPHYDKADKDIRKQLDKGIKQALKRAAENGPPERATLGSPNGKSGA